MKKPRRPGLGPRVLRGLCVMERRYDPEQLIPGYEDLSPEDRRREFPEEEDVLHAMRWIRRFAYYKHQLSRSCEK